MALSDRVIAVAGRHPAVREIELVGSRAEGYATELSDWDFRVQTDDFDALAAALPSLVAELEPLAAQWDRLSAEWCYMLILRGPVKVDLIFHDRPHADEPPWQPTRENLADLDAHFWDWVLWLNAKEVAGKTEQVAAELQKLTKHLLRPLGVEPVPSSVADAVTAYRSARDRVRRELGASVPRELEQAVVPALSRR